MVELEQLNQYRFYTLEPKFLSKCTNIVENIYERKTGGTRTCNSLLNLNMIDGSVNMRCPQLDCQKQYDIPRVCTACGREHLFDDLTCDTCEPVVINITTWKVSVEECKKAIKKINRAFKQDIIKDAEWKISIRIQEEEMNRCLASLEKIGWD